MSQTKRAERWLPLAYLVVAMALVVAVLPSVLRQAPPEQSQSAELSPDAPPNDEQQSIISSLNRAQSGTAGDLTGLEGAAETPDVAEVAKPTLACRGFGNPPRQTESLYSAPCGPPCPTNAGATSKHVTGSEIRIALKHGAVDATYGPVSPTARDGESAADRTLRVYQTYFNQRFQTCGRVIRLYNAPDDAADDVEPARARAAAAAIDEEQEAFASYVLNWETCDELARRGLVVFCNPMPRRLHTGYPGQVWSWMTDLTSVDEFAAELTCKQLKDKPASFTTDPALQGQPRKIGVLYWSAPAGGFRDPSDFEKPYREQCGGTVAVPIGTGGKAEDLPQAAAAISRLKSQGVTTVVLAHSVVATLAIMSAATQQLYFPEWILPTPYAVDFNLWGRILPPEQSRSTFGFSMWEIPRPRTETDCYVAYKTVDPAGEPDDGTCRLHFPYLLQIVNGIQAAGRTLTVRTFEQGMFRLGRHYYPERWSIGGGYGPADYTYADDFGLIWWDANAVSGADGQPGAYRWVNDGRRYKRGEIPTEPVGFFASGVPSM